MRHLRPFPVLVAVAVIGAACSGSSPAASSAGSPSQAAQQSQASSPSQGGQASQPAASTGGGGGGGGANGSMTYEITGDYQASGELPYVVFASSWIEQSGGWVAYFQTADPNSAVIQINTQAAAGTPGQIWNFGDGKVLVLATSDPGSGTGCTFTLTKNDASGTEGQLACTSAPMTRLDTGASGRVKVTAHWSGHP